MPWPDKSAKGKRLKAKRRAEQRAYAKKHYRDNKRKYATRARDRHLWVKYGWSEEQYVAREAELGGLCASCRRPETSSDPRSVHKVRRLSVDHNHVTKQVRDLLCDSCNRALGFLKEDPQRIRALADYIEHHNGK